MIQSEQFGMTGWDLADGHPYPTQGSCGFWELVEYY